MIWLPDSTLAHLRDVADWPDLSATKYDVIERLGSGGMATVYLAHDRDLDRDVAIKVLNGSGGPSDLGNRMRQEARILARLAHPSIVPVHDAGALPDGRIFYVMKLVDGERLDAYAGAGRTLPEMLRIFERICEAVAFAHAAGVIHRDLKPENIMVGLFGEALIMDWGAAKLREVRDADAVDARRPPAPTGTDTAHGTILGTPGYMAPEQACGDVGAIDERTDVYALGALLVFLVSHAEDVTAPRTLAPLRAISAKAMAADPSARYDNVVELGRETARYLAGLRVEAHREGPVDALSRFASRHRTPLVLVLAYLLMRALLLIFTR